MYNSISTAQWTVLCGSVISARSSNQIDRTIAASVVVVYWKWIIIARGWTIVLTFTITNSLYCFWAMRWSIVYMLPRHRCMISYSSGRWVLWNVHHLNYPIILACFVACNVACNLSNVCECVITWNTFY